MRITINGESADVPEGVNVATCLEEQGFNPAVVVVERNRHIVPAGDFAATRVEEGDILEILHFVGGG